MLKVEEKIWRIHGRLEIPENYEKKSGLHLQLEENDLVGIGDDIFGRPQKLAKQAETSWTLMKSSAEKDDIILQVVSVFRSIDKQAEIIQRKIDSGQLIADILRVSAAPGYSEHHTGRAIDLTTEECTPLTEAFEKTLAFKWLQENAHLFSFSLSYPKDNKYGIAYEPWHWAYSEG